jgi:hypothetical protein
MTFNINEKIFKFIFVKENQICMFAKNKIFLLKYELIFDDKNEGNLLNVNIYIIKEILLNENPFLDSLKFKNHKNQELLKITINHTLNNIFPNKNQILLS